MQAGQRALRHGIGVGRPGFAWSGLKTVSRKAEWPDWTPPAEMLARRPDLPRHMAGGPENPLGARALYLGSSLYRIHGTNEPNTIGQSVSSGCIRMMNDDVIDLYERVRSERASRSSRPDHAPDCAGHEKAGAVARGSQETCFNLSNT
ncbi:L,D-transpeptidase [Methylobacterium oryzae CBMB20]